MIIFQYNATMGGRTSSLIERIVKLTTIVNVTCEIARSFRRVADSGEEDVSLRLLFVRSARLEKEAVGLGESQRK